MDPCPPLFLGFWLGWLWNSVCLNTHFLQNLHPESDLWFLTYGKMPTITRRIRTVPFKVISARFLSFLPEQPLHLRVFPFEELFPSFCVCGLGAGEDNRVSFPRLMSSWRKLRASPVDHCPFAFHWSQTPFPLSMPHDPLLFSFQQWHSLFGVTNTPVSILSFRAWKFLVLIIWPFCCRPREMLISFLFVHCQCCFELIRLSFSPHTNFPESCHWEPHLLTIKLDPIRYQNLDYRRHVKWYWIDLKNQEQLQVSPTP